MSPTTWRILSLALTLAGMTGCSLLQPSDHHQFRPLGEPPALELEP
ncbi:hypothetical protein RRX38_01775 [Pseudomonas sp. DTU_2021_1001937_2_SI_NGA_ILE_001]|nr:hypothetical protein [Pseudomonas sp. DTU_2021_1001937_2_SI_NGA_ILE_001]WNW09925.1 hypothetical protein RRX38_01775 [Pseudomonas sp. DTU_2021_1001937_2_SI_NGA_ILE_001]